MNEKEADLQSWRACRRLLTSVCTQTTRNRTFTTRVTKSFTTTGVDRNSYQMYILYLGLFLPKWMNFWKIFEQPLTFEIMLHISPEVYDQNDFFICTKFAMAFLDFRQLYNRYKFFEPCAQGIGRPLAGLLTFILYLCMYLYLRAYLYLCT